MERIRFHVSKLEICMRLVNNETLESKRVMDALKEPFEMYIEALDPESENDAESFDPETTGIVMVLPRINRKIWCLESWGISNVISQTIIRGWKTCPGYIFHYLHHTFEGIIRFRCL